MRQLRGERGSVIVETALAMIFLQILLLGMFDLANGFSTYIGLSNAAREGARWISIHVEDPDGGIALVESHIAGLKLQGTYEIELENAQAVYGPGDIITVKIKYYHPVLFGAIPGIDTVEFPIEANMRAMYEPSIKFEK